jgi:hypothetical protein
VIPAPFTIDTNIDFACALWLPKMERRKSLVLLKTRERVEEVVDIGHKVIAESNGASLTGYGTGFAAIVETIRHPPINFITVTSP